MSVVGSAPQNVPRFVTLGLIPLANLAAAFIISGLVVVIVGDDPLQALEVMLYGAFGSAESWGFTLYYATNFVFTGLAVAIAFHCGLFNIGGEGQAMLGGLGVGLVCLGFDDWPFVVVFPLAIVACALFGAAWAFVPGYLQAKRGSHVVITTIMFNFLASALMTYLLVEVLIAPGQQSPESREFAPGAWLPYMHDMLRAIGISMPETPLNLAFVVALAASVFVYYFVWRTRWGYEIRTVGQNETAAVYAGISPSKNIILAMAISGALAGFVGLNEIMGVQHRLILDFSGGYGFVGIAVALMGRNHPVGIALSALLFGALYQGGTELAFEMDKITREMVVVIQGFVILFAGALEHMFRPQLESLFTRRSNAAAPAGE
ncbi:ABC transporter permease [Oceanibacterium hippocampi]|uniref:D-allose transporter subunit n=1 Tax=Oceanibacterium hippocampi TaxID=745714 RepID=A0A1Y5U1P4_9PROT|nr:ABC transporter permease [Oceanibacterium hippocampi]SLN74696.1 D-allose transporter subunit [Oceanibacterium hippocampi]